jgi:hypothetical protein
MDMGANPLLFLPSVVLRPASNLVVQVRILGIELVIVALLVVAWYLAFVQLNRRRATRVIRWIERTFAGHAAVVGNQWLASSRFRVRLRMPTGVFRDPSVLVQMCPRELPARWMMWRFRKRPETLTFEADLDYAPSFSLEVHNHRWFGRTRRRFPSHQQNWTTESIGPVVLTTRNDWQREITTMMNTLVASHDCDCLAVSIRRSSPHFSATVPLEAISPGSQAQGELFDIFRELAQGASSTPRF